ncbi:hypothetical protein quinque_008842 [Culex quinquefasciatus]
MPESEPPNQQLTNCEEEAQCILNAVRDSDKPSGAFDRVDTPKVGVCSEEIWGYPVYLINRIIRTCLMERTSLQWFGQRTAVVEKNRGVKQGCPISPYIFTLLIHHVLLTLLEFIPELRLEHIGTISLPCVLAYADDLLFLVEKVEDVSRILDSLQPLLASIGLEINHKKTRVLIRDPALIDNREPDSKFMFGTHELVLVTKLRYLGAFITSSLTRTETTAERIKKAEKAFRTLCAFLTKFNLKWKRHQIPKKRCKDGPPECLHEQPRSTTPNQNHRFSDFHRLTPQLIAHHPEHAGDINVEFGAAAGEADVVGAQLRGGRRTKTPPSGDGDGASFHGGAGDRSH